MSSRLEGGFERIVGGYDSPEGPAFDRQGRLHFVNWLSSSIVRVELDGSTSEWFNTGGIPAGLAFHPDGSLYVADEGDDIHGVLRLTPDRERHVMAATYNGEPLNGANDLVFDANGVLYFSDPWRSSLENPVGGFYRLFPDGRLEQLDTGLAFPNGVALAPDGSAAYLAETRTNAIHRYAIRPDGSVGPRESWARLEGEPGPDGMAFDAEGHLWVAHVFEGTLDVLDQAGRTVERFPTPGVKPTNVAFGGPDRRTVVLTEVDSAAVYRARSSVAGLRLYGDV